MKLSEVLVKPILSEKINKHVKKVIKSNSKWVAKKHGFKSGLEESISNQIDSKGIKVMYETEKIVPLKKIRNDRFLYGSISPVFLT